MQSNLHGRENDAELEVAFERKLNEIVRNLKTHFKSVDRFQDIIANSRKYRADDLIEGQKPESLVRQFVVDPLLEFLRFSSIRETTMPTPHGIRAPDYFVSPVSADDPRLYVEVEPMNADLRREGEGISQIREWLFSRASKTDYGMATNGIEWILVKFDKSLLDVREVRRFDLRKSFLKAMNAASLLDDKELAGERQGFLRLHAENILDFLSANELRVEQKKEEISESFYDHYVRAVFGRDVNGGKIEGGCLLDQINAPAHANGENEKNLFAVILMNRLIFIKFLEEKGIVDRNLLNSIFDQYRSSRLPSTFYASLLKPLFYNVFNTPVNERPEHVAGNPVFASLPYLNGGLFREVIRFESEYDVGNDGIELVVRDLLERYRFQLKTGEGINPDILGYIFEKTINFISGTGNMGQKMKGAYYTPNDVVEFIVSSTLVPVVHERLTRTLREAGFDESVLSRCATLSDILDPANLPTDRNLLRKMIDEVERITVLDPACGSGHFLTAILSEFVRIKEYLIKAAGGRADRYRIKRDIISQNIFGVDIDPNAVEIARLRLWLSLIDEVKGERHVEALPNIDFNIIAGNSLIGLRMPSTERLTLTLWNKDAVGELFMGLSSVHPLKAASIRNSILAGRWHP
ncbi:MAG: N-6 DNA methylase [Thermoplasmata archaeon]|nr:N-6 DNA methylase [Candidatus Sysuiplasma jiujiangense]